MHQSGVKGFGRKVGGCYHACLVRIDGIDAIVQNLRNDLIMADPQTDEDVANPAFFATVKADAPATVEAGVVSMTGFYKPTETENYFLGDDTYLHKSTATAKAFRAYFAISTGAAHMPARVVMRGSGEQGTTELEKVQRDQEPSTKVIRNGQLVIIRDGKTFNALGTEVK